jgi:hypothetical protein
MNTMEEGRKWEAWLKRERDATVAQLPPVLNWSGEFPEGEKCPQYIRADLVEKLKGYEISHKPDCKFVIVWIPGLEKTESGCTCGLTEVLKEMGDGS